MQELKTEKSPLGISLPGQDENEFTKKKQLRHERALSRILPSWMFNPLGISDEFLFRNNFNDHKMHFIRARNIFPHSRESFSYRVTFNLQSGNSQLS